MSATVARVGLDFDPIDEARRNWQLHGWGDGQAMVAATSITRAHQIVLAEINAALTPFGLTFSRFEVLALLFFARDNSLPMGKVGARLQVHPTSVTSLVNRLEQDALVQRIAHPTDRRTILVQLTPQGRALAPRCAAALEQVGFGLTGLNGTQLDIVADTVTDMRRASGDWSPSPAPSTGEN